MQIGTIDSRSHSSSGKALINVLDRKGITSKEKLLEEIVKDY